MSAWVIVSWVLVAVLTAINVFVFLKLKQASEQLMKMAFPNAKGMGDAMAQMQRMMGSMGGMGGMGGFGGPGGRPGAGAGGNANMEAQMRAAMQMLQQMGKKK